MTGRGVGANRRIGSILGGWAIPMSPFLLWRTPTCRGSMALAAPIRPMTAGALHLRRERLRRRLYGRAGPHGAATS